MHLPHLSAGAKDNGSGSGDFEKPLDMLLAKELEMLKENASDSMDERGQEDAQFEMEIDNEETGGRETAALTKIARKIMSAGSVEAIQIELNG